MLEARLDGQPEQGSISRIVYSVDGTVSQFALMPNQKLIHIPNDSPKLVYQSNERLILFGKPGGLFTIQFADRLNDQSKDLREFRLDAWQKTIPVIPQSTGARFYRALMVD